MDRPDLNYKKGKYRIVDTLCYAEFLSLYMLDSKPKPDLLNDCQPEVLEDDVSENYHHYPKFIPLMNSKEK